MLIITVINNSLTGTILDFATITIIANTIIVAIITIIINFIISKTFPIVVAVVTILTIYLFFINKFK